MNFPSIFLVALASIIIRCNGHRKIIKIPSSRCFNGNVSSSVSQFDFLAALNKLNRKQIVTKSTATVTERWNWIPNLSRGLRGKKCRKCKIY